MECCRGNNKKDNKKTDSELYQLISEKISTGNYVLLSHAKQRLRERRISDIEVLDILEGRNGRARRNKKIDKYEDNTEDWNYCIEGKNPDGESVRIIISFENDSLLVITVIRLKKRGKQDEDKNY